MVDQLITVDSDGGPREPEPVSVFVNGQIVDFAVLIGGTTASPTQPARLVSSAASTNALNFKSSATRLIGIMGYSTRQDGCYLKLYNKASQPTVGTDIPALTFYIPPLREFPEYTLGPLLFPLGLGMALTTGSADADTGPVAAGDVMGLNIAFT